MHAILHLAVECQLEARKNDGRNNMGIRIQVLQQLLNLINLQRFDDLHLWDGEELRPASLGASVIQSVAHEPQVRQVSDGRDVGLWPLPFPLLAEEAHGQNVILRMRRRKLGEEVLLHFLHGFAIIQQLIDQDHLVGHLADGVAELRARQVTGDVHRTCLGALVLVRRRLDKVDRVRPDQVPAKVREEHEGALEDGHQHNSLALAPSLDAACGDADAGLNLFLLQNELVVFLILEIFGQSQRRLHVAIAQRCEKSS
mmetsp:Transcript_8518/g.15877  ORF Transcript_8518/g.15877 Transcript_8518/m.15877 type:complete len:256 (-) Transcript_8518:423-1190(-)